MTGAGGVAGGVSIPCWRGQHPFLEGSASLGLEGSASLLLEVLEGSASLDPFCCPLNPFCCPYQHRSAVDGTGREAGNDFDTDN